jgi:phosphoglycolate phosphatase-like HAD superfamily hydrolase
MVARLCYRQSVRLCVFDLDHTLVRSPLDLVAMARDMRSLLEARCGPLPPRPERYRVGELITYCQTKAPELEPPLWEVALDHERRALAEASLEPGAREAVVGARGAGFGTALWTNNARGVTLAALARCGLDDGFDLVVTRDDMRELKPDPDGWRVIAAHFGDLPAVAGAADRLVFMVGDSWVDGVAATAAGVPFIAYRADATDLTRWQVIPVAHLTDLARLPAWLAAQRGEG